MVSAPFDNEQYRNQGNKATEKRTVIRKLSIAPRSLVAYLCLLRRNFCAAGGRFSFVTAVRFLDGQEALSLTTAAQNMRVLLRKSPLSEITFSGS